MKTHITILAIIFVFLGIVPSNALDEKANKDQIPKPFPEREHNYQHSPGFKEMNKIKDRELRLTMKSDRIQSNNYLVDSVIVFKEDGINERYTYTFNENNLKLTLTVKKLEKDVWVNDRRYLNTFDDSENIILSLQERWVDGKWENYAKAISIYDTHGNILNRNIEEWKNQKWEITWKDTYYYYDHLKLRLYIGEDWYNNDWYTIYCEEYTYDEESNLLIELRESGYLEHGRYLYSYDENGNLITESHENEADIIGFDNDWTKSYTYDENGNIKTTLHENWIFELWPSHGEWENSGRNTYSYDSNNYLIEILFEGWGLELEWENSKRSSYSYDENKNLITELKELWDFELGWINSERFTYTYDDNSNLITEFWEIWESEWQNTERFTYTYDDNNNLIKYLHDKWENQEWIGDNDGFSFEDFYGNYYYFNGYNIEIYWGKPTSVKSESNDNFTFTAFPNPCNNMLNISHIPPVAKIELYNTMGYKVYDVERVTGNTQNIDCSNFENGVYFLIITGNEKSHFKRIVILK